MVVCVIQVAIVATLCALVMVFGDRGRIGADDARWPRRVSAIVAVGCLVVIYPWRDDVRVLGFPLPEAVFQRHGDHWLDYVWGALTLPIYVANGVFGWFLPRVVWALVRRVRRRRVV